MPTPQPRRFVHPRRPQPDAPRRARRALVARVATCARTVAATLFAVAVLVGLPLGGHPASAHAQLLSSSPAHSDRLESAPAAIELHFNEDLLDIGSAVSVVDSSGAEWAATQLEIDGPRATAELTPGMPDDRYELRWQVVSADGHPISGIIPFTIGDASLDAAAGGAAGAAGEGAASSGTADSGSSSGAGSGSEATAPDAAGTQAGALPAALRTVLIGLAGAAVGGGTLWLITAIRRRQT